MKLVVVPETSRKGDRQIMLDNGKPGGVGDKKFN